MKIRNDDFSHSEPKNPNNISQDYLKNKEQKSRFEFLYENSSIHNKKLDLMRAKNYFNEQEKMIPVITKKAQEINRPKELFFKRLHNSNNYVNIKYSLEKSAKKSENKRTIETKEKNEKTILDNMSDGNKDLNDIVNNNDEESLYIINDKKKNEEHRKLYKSPKKQSVSFLFKPEINTNSKKIANKIKTKSRERLMSLSANQKNNLRSIIKQREKEKEKKLKAEKEKILFKENNNTYKPLVKNNKRIWVDKLYEKGIKSIKQKQEKMRNEKIKKETEYLKYSYSPIVNRNHSYTSMFKRKNYSTNFTYNKNNSNNNNLSISKTNIYERNKKWKNAIEEKNSKLKTKLNNSILNDSNYCFSPNLNNNIMDTDISFIGKNIIEYETFLDRYNYSKYKKKLDKINYRKSNIPPRQIYQKKLVVEFVSECDSNCQTNSGTIKLSCDKRPIDEIHKNREKLKINDFFGNNVKLQSNVFFKDNINNNNNNNDKNKNKNEYSFFDKNLNIGKDRLDSYLECKNIYNRNVKGNLSFFNAVNSIINKID